MHLFGNSLGGAVAVQLAARPPDLVRTLTLVSPALPQDRAAAHEHPPAGHRRLPAARGRADDKYLTLDAEPAGPGHRRRLLRRPGRGAEQRLAEATAEVRRRDGLPYVQDAFTQSLRGLLATYLDTSGARAVALAERIAVPTLLVYGLRDKLVDPIAAHSNAFPDRRVLLVMHCGHVAQLEAPDLVNEAWRELPLRAGTEAALAADAGAGNTVRARAGWRNAGGVRSGCTSRTPVHRPSTARSAPPCRCRPWSSRPPSSPSTRSAATRRHLIIPDVGMAGQKRLKNAKVLVRRRRRPRLARRCCTWPPPASGTLGIIEFDVVDESNLQRQIIHGQSDIGRAKAESARDSVRGDQPATSNVVLHEDAARQRQRAGDLRASTT